MTWLRYVSSLERWRPNAIDVLEDELASAQWTRAILGHHNTQRWGRPIFQFEIGFAVPDRFENGIAYLVERNLGATAQTSVVPDLVQSAWQDVLQEAVQECEHRKLHLPFVSLTAEPICKSHLATFQREDAVVRDRCAQSR